MQIIRGPDGKVSVRGLNPGQHLIQMPDGSIQIVTAQQGNKAAGPTATGGATGVKIIGRQPAVTSGQQIVIRQPTTSTTATKPVIHKIIQASPAAGGSATQVPKIIGGKLIASSTTVGQAVTPAPQQQRILTTSLQQLLAQNPGQKIVVGQGTPNQKIFISSTKSGSGAGQPQQQIVFQQSPQPQQSLLINQPQLLNTMAASTSQQIMVGNQRIILNPGQRIITQTGGAAVLQPQAISTSGGSAGPVKIVSQQTIVPASTTSQYQIQTTQPAPAQQSQFVLQSNSAMAQQLASGKLQIINYNGQQVIVKPMENNQAQIVAHVKQQENGPAQIVAAPAAVQQQQQQQQPAIVAAQAPEPMAESALVDSHLEAELKKHPPGTVIKSVTAQVVQTADGPRIVLQGLSNKDLTPQQMALVQQQIKQQLLKGEERIP